MEVMRGLLASAVFAALLGCSAGGNAVPYPVDATSIAPGQQLENLPGWHRDAVIYHVWVKAFADGIHTDGIGDLPGLRSRLDHLQSLGINTIWLSPIFECAYKGDNMHGYDTTDYYKINDRFGGLTDVKNLLDDAHGRGMRVLMDFAPNHTATSHRWFTDEATRGSWYIWKSAPPAGWGYPWGGGKPEDVWKIGNGGYFYTAFGVDSLADLNFYNPAVRSAVLEIQRYWLDRGFDGLRVDAARHLCESGPGQQADQPDTHARLKEFRTLLDEYSGGSLHPHPGNDPSRHSAKIMIAEAWTDTAGVAPYYGNGSDEFHMCLDFDAPWAIFNAISREDATLVSGLWELQKSRFPAGATTATFDSNHDNVISRPGTQYGGDRRKIILAEALNLLSPGTPIIYYGNEVAMTGQSGSDINLRRNMDWAAVTAQSADPESVLSWCRYLIQARKAYPALRGGYATLGSDAAGKVLACIRSAGDERVIVVANLTGSTRSATLQDLPAHGVAPGAGISAILGELKGNGALQGNNYTVRDLPPFGVRVLHAGGGTFKGTLHGDLK